MKNIHDFVTYGDTDSVVVDINSFILNNIKDKQKWIDMPDNDKIEYIKKISKIVEDYINDKILNHVQFTIYNSIESDFQIHYKQEKIAKTGIFLKKKKYATHTILDEGKYKDDISATGLEIIRSDTPLLFKEGLYKILDMILRNYSDDDIKQKANEYIKKANTLAPSELSSNIGINNLDKYIKEGNSCAKGTPWHVKGVANYRKLLNILNLENKYPIIQEGVKARVIYVKNNPYGIDAITYQIWPKEFDKMGIVPDYNKMIKKFFKSKINYLLEPINKENLLNGNDEKLQAFFG